MTDRFNALSALVQSGHALATPALARFTVCSRVKNWCWTSGLPCKLVALTGLARCYPPYASCSAPRFSYPQPNRARSVIFSYCSANPGAFHRADAAGYVFWSEQVLELDAINPQVAAAWRVRWTAGKSWQSPTATLPAKHWPASLQDRFKQRCA